MKILTYFSNGNRMPDVLVNMPIDPKHDRHTDPGLIAFVEKHIRRDPGLVLDVYIHMHPNELFHCETLHRPDGIVRHYFFGNASPDENCSVNTTVGVCLNIYDENTTKVYIDEYDGSETLVPVPKYEPVENAPGLYQRED